MKKVFSTLKKGILYLRVNGISQTYKKVKHYLKYTRVNTMQFNEAYKSWMKNCEKEDFTHLEEEMKKFTYRPLFSICIPVYNVEECWLRKCIESVQSQYYAHWQLCLADDCSTDEHVREVLREYEEQDRRITVIYRKENGHISRATNSAIEAARGEFIVLMDNDDEMAPFALFEVAKFLQDYKDADVIYSDEDKISEEGQRMDPYFKPDYCPDTLLSYNYISHLGVYRKTLVNEIGGFRAGVEGAQDYDLLLRITEKTDKICHIPKVLYHWRAIAGSTALDGGEKNYAYQAGKKVLEDAVERRKYNAKVEFLNKILCYNVKFYPKKKHLISIIIPTKDKAEVLERCLDSIYRSASNIIKDGDVQRILENAGKTPEETPGDIGKAPAVVHPDFEIIVIDNDSQEKKTFALFEKYSKKDNFRVLPLKIPFNYSKLNNEAAKIAKGDLLLFLNNDIEVITENWLTFMAGEAERKEIGAVGTKLLYPDNTVQHAGVVLGIKGIAAHMGIGKEKDDNGYMSHLAMRRNYSAVTAACLMIRREIFEKVGGFEEELKVAFNDIDFCMKVREKGYYNLFLADVLLYHYESLSRGLEDNSQKIDRYQSEIAYMQKKWGDKLLKDPCFNQNFDLNVIGIQIKTFLS